MHNKVVKSCFFEQLGKVVQGQKEQTLNPNARNKKWGQSYTDV